MGVTPLRASSRSTGAQPVSSRPGGRAAKGLDDDSIRGGRAGRHGTEGSAALAERVIEPVAAKRPRLRLAPPIPVAAPRTPFVLLIVLIVVAGVVGILVLNTKINQDSFVLENLRKEQNALDQREQQLNQVIAEAESPNSLAAAAKMLGLVPADAPAYIRLPDGKIIGVPRPASGTPSITSQ
jgi:hypothetical protein